MTQDDPIARRSPARPSTQADLEGYLKRVEQKVLAFLETSGAVAEFHPDELKECVWSYVRRPAKRLRPAVLLMSCGSVGGELERALPAAAGIEVFHTWTLVHDDLIDNDRTRRGAPTVHAAMADRKRQDHGWAVARAEEYGRDIAILAGDMQHGWAITLFLECATRRGVDPRVVVALVEHLQSSVLGKLIGGEVLDVQFGMAPGAEWREIDEDRIVEMLRLKTGVLYEYAGLAGACIGLDKARFDDPLVSALTRFAGKCGIAFQLQDDILGITGDERTLGKPVGSDIREGKKTVIVYEALTHGSESQRAEILAVLGKRDAAEAEVHRVSQLLRDLGGIVRTQDIAQRCLQEARSELAVVPGSEYKDLLLSWADFMLKRTF
jgi:geranylgeranyl diphosphate synthase type I